MAALTAVGASFLFPTDLVLVNATIEQVPPANLKEVLTNLLLNLVANPVNAIAEANYIGILAWAIIIGFALRQASDTARTVVGDFADAISQVVKWVIALAPLGILGLVANPLIVLIKTGKNPYPLVFTCLRESGITAFLPAAQQLIFRST